MTCAERTMLRSCWPGQQLLLSSLITCCCCPSLPLCQPPWSCLGPRLYHVPSCLKVFLHLKHFILYLPILIPTWNEISLLSPGLIPCVIATHIAVYTSPHSFYHNLKSITVRFLSPSLESSADVSVESKQSALHIRSNHQMFSEWSIWWYAKWIRQKI